MTLRELSQLYWLRREIEADRERLRSLKEQKYSLSPPDLSGMPKGGNMGNRIERCAVEIAALEKAIEEKSRRCIQEKIRLERYIATIPDSLTRQIFLLRFSDGLSWVQVAIAIGGNNSSDGVKKVCYRYIRANNDCRNREGDKK